MPKNLMTITLADEVYHYLWNEISSLRLEPGEKLSEVKLAKQFNCSRIPVREAVQRLVTDGALEVIPQKGSFVSAIDTEHLERVRYLREVLETRIIMDDFDDGLITPILPVLKSIVEKQRTLVALNDYENAFSLDINFHSLFYSICHKDFVQKYTGVNDIHYYRARLITMKGESNNIMVDQHQEIIDAIEAKDRDRLLNALNTHFTNVNKSIKLQPYMTSRSKNFFS